MPNRIMLLVSAVSFCLALVTTSGGAARAADECLAGPNKEAPQGSHWYYRVERGTQRKCWHLGDEGKVAAAPAAASDAIKPEPRQARSTAQAPVGDAHAEWVDAPRIAPAMAPLASAQPAPLALADPATSGGRPADAAHPATIASRWPKPGEMMVADNTDKSVPTDMPAASPAPLASNTDAQAIAAPAEAAPQSPETAGRGLADDLPFALFAGVLVCIGILGWAAIRLLMVQRSMPNQRLDPHRWTREQEDMREDAPHETRGGALLQMGEIAMFSEEAAAPPDVATHRAPAPPRSFDEEIDEIERLLAIARQAGARTPSPSLWDVPHDQPSASK